MLAGLDRFDPMALGFVGRQLPALELPVLLPFAGVQPLAALGATINTISLRDPILLIAPVLHSLCLRQWAQHQRHTAMNRGIVVSFAAAPQSHRSITRREAPG